MHFPTLLVEAKLVRRYKRFFADMELDDGSVVTAHCANPGSMLGLNQPGLQCFLSRADNPTRKLRWSWELIQDGNAMIGINTSLPNRLAAEALAQGKLQQFTHYQTVQREVRTGPHTRLDFKLSSSDLPDCYIEVKNVHLKRDKASPGFAEFPDSVTDRGAKHLRELSMIKTTGARAVLLFIVQRTDCSTMRLATDIDPVYATAMTEAIRAGVEVLCYDCDITPQDITIRQQIAFDPSPGLET